MNIDINKKHDELILHIGMHKTGSSSIQNYFHKIKNLAEVEYLNIFCPNHSGFILNIFLKNPEKYHANIKNDRTISDVYKNRERYIRILRDYIFNLKKSKMLISAEGLTFLTYHELKNLNDYFLKYFKKITIVGYVRSPLSFMQSAFQQFIKGSMNFFNPNEYYPNYVDIFNKFFEVFGNENVRLAKFDNHILYNGNVVNDFCKRFLGLEINNSIDRDNSSLALEATALLFLQRKYGTGYGQYLHSPKDNELLIERLSLIGKRKILFGKKISDEVREKNKDNIEWINNKLGIKIDDYLEHEVTDSINNEEDLINVGINQVSEVNKLIYYPIKKIGKTPKNVALLVDLLKFQESGRYVGEFDTLPFVVPEINKIAKWPKEENIDEISVNKEIIKNESIKIDSENKKISLEYKKFVSRKPYCVRLKIRSNKNSIIVIKYLENTKQQQKILNIVKGNQDLFFSIRGIKNGIIEIIKKSEDSTAILNEFSIYNLKGINRKYKENEFKKLKRKTLNILKRIKSKFK